MIIHKLLDIFNYKSEYQKKDSNILSNDMYVLERIYFNKKITISDISKKYNIAPSTLTGIVDRLENKKLIKRYRTEEDRRTVNLSITKEGDIVIKKHIKEDEIFSKNFFKSLETNKRESLKKLLLELLENIKKEELFLEDKKK